MLSNQNCYIFDFIIFLLLIWINFITFIFKYNINKYLSKYVERGFCQKFDPATISTIPDSKPYRLEYKILRNIRFLSNHL